MAYCHLRSLRSCIPDSTIPSKSFDPMGNRHHCLVHSPLQITLWDLRRLGIKSTTFPQDKAKGILRYLLQALDFLHREANITHCGTLIGLTGRSPANMSQIGAHELSRSLTEIGKGALLRFASSRTTVRYILIAMSSKTCHCRLKAEKGERASTPIAA